MKIFSACQYLMIGISAMVLAGCATPESKDPITGAPSVAAVKCNRSGDAQLGSMIRKDCSAAPSAQTVNTQDFMNALQTQTPGSIPSQR